MQQVERFVGIDVGAEKHVVAVVDGQGGVVLKPVGFGEDAEGYARLAEQLGSPAGALVAMEATGHYWQNLFAWLAWRGFSVVLLNPLRTHRFAGEDMRRAKTDAQDALLIARLAQQKRPQPTPVPDALTGELKEAVALRERLLEDYGVKLRQLHRLVDLGFPEFTRHVQLDSELACALLADYPTAQAFAKARLKGMANLKYDGRHLVGLELAGTLQQAAKVSVGAHHSAPYQQGVKYACEDLRTLRARLAAVNADISSTLHKHEVGSLLTSLQGIGDITAARLIAAVGNPAQLHSGSALAAYVGCVPAIAHSGKHTPSRQSISSLGNARLRAALWMPTLVAVQKNPWLRSFYERLLSRGKPKKVALVACMRKLLLALYSIAKNRRPFTLPTPPSPNPSLLESPA